MMSAISCTECSQVAGLMDKNASLGGSGGMLPQEILEIRCSEIASQAIFGQKQSCSSYMALEVLHATFGCPFMHLLSQLTLNFHKRRLAEQQVG